MTGYVLMWIWIDHLNIAKHSDGREVATAVEEKKCYERNDVNQ